VNCSVHIFLVDMTSNELKPKKKKKTKQTNKKKQILVTASQILRNSGPMEQIIWENFNPHN